MTLRDNAGKRIRLQCHRNARGKGSTKTNCIRAITVSLVDGLFQVTKNVTGHDHPLLPAPTELLGDDITETTRFFCHCGAAPVSVAMFIKLRYGVDLSAYNLDQVMKAEIPNFADTESEPDTLLRTVHDKGGICCPDYGDP
jgi:hypothetical protein